MQDFVGIATAIYHLLLMLYNSFMYDKVKVWLILCAIMVLIIVWIGGVTRLTNSGLSITEWEPIVGVMPPLTEQSWLQEKVKYEQTPEYKKVNFDISMSEFKKIYIIEYLHRIFARLIGVVFFVPFVYFVALGKLTRREVVLLSCVLIAILLQGFMGWYMVQSGLINVPHVSHYRLSMHLSLAAIIFSMLLYTAFSCGQQKSVIKIPLVYFLSCSTLILIMLQILLGGLVAGLKAGLVYNTFPLMDGSLIPNGIFALSPVWKNAFDNITTVQFLHRLLGMIIFVSGLCLFVIQKSRFILIVLLAMVIQITLGILTLIYHIPIFIASLHQVGAFVMLGLMVYSFVLLRYRPQRKHKYNYRQI